jgi:hypothetical protein
VLEHFQSIKDELAKKEKQLLDVLRVNHRLELDLVLMTRQLDFIEPKLSKLSLPARFKDLYSDQAYAKHMQDACILPRLTTTLPVGSRKDWNPAEPDWVWEFLPFEKRMQRALTRPLLEGGEPKLAPLDFYGQYSRISSEHQRILDAET